MSRAGNTSAPSCLLDGKWAVMRITECVACAWHLASPREALTRLLSAGGLRPSCPARRLPQSRSRGTYSSAIMSPWGCFMCLAMAASASSMYSSFSESDTFCRATSRCSGCRPSCSRARS